ncbi:MAG: alpha/beta fold hydrolase [Ilumatobacteraceae bacterium]
MTTFVLVHGAWSGSHGFRHVRRLLAAAGHVVFTPSLTGIGERAHLVSPQVSLSTHVADVTNVILYEDLVDIVLVGFSYGGVVVTGCLEHVADRVAHLVYLDAFVPDDGDSVERLVGRNDHQPMAIGDRWLVPGPPRRCDDPAEDAFMAARRGEHPRRCFTEPVRLLAPLDELPFSRTYIRATADEPDAPGSAAFDAAALRAKSSEAWQYREVATNHMVANNRPEELATLLSELADGRRQGDDVPHG